MGRDGMGWRPGSRDSITVVETGLLNSTMVPELQVRNYTVYRGTCGRPGVEVFFRLEREKAENL